MDLSQLTPRRPYLLRAFYEWLLDNQLTPHMFEPEAAYDEDTSIMNDEEASADNETVMSVIDGDKPDHDDDTHPDDEPPQPPRGGRPALRVVK